MCNICVNYERRKRIKYTEIRVYALGRRLLFRLPNRELGEIYESLRSKRSGETIGDVNDIS